MSERLIWEAPEELEGRMGHIARRLMEAWLEQAIPELDPMLSRFQADDSGVYLVSEPYIDASQYEELARQAAEAFEACVDWEQMSKQWALLRYKGEQLELWELDKELAANVLTPEQVELALALDADVASLEGFEQALGRGLSRKDFALILAKRAETKYRVRVYDNARYQDEEAAVTLLGSYESAEEAVGACQKMVLEYLIEVGYDLEKYQAFGPDPTVVSPRGYDPVVFSAWDFAKQQCEADGENLG